MRKPLIGSFGNRKTGALRCSAEPTHGEDAGFSRRSVGLQLADALYQLKALVHDANRIARHSSDVVSDDVARKVLNGFLQFYGLLECTIGDASPADEQTKQEVGLLVQQELLPY